MTEHMRYDEYMAFIVAEGLLKGATGEAIDFGFKVWLKTVVQCENLLKQTEACTDVHQC